MKVIPREVVKRKKHITWSREIREMQKKFNLKLIQEQVLIGTVLGDACLIPNVGGKKYRLQIEHCVKQKKYVWWKHEIFRGAVVSTPKFQVRTNSVRFRTISHPVFGEFYNLFYKDKKKILPKNINKLLDNSVSLAVWFMDDGALGNKAKNPGLILNTQGFSLDENQRLQECLKNNFGLSTTLHKDKEYWRIYIAAYSVPLFRTIVQDDILPEFKYKLSFY